MDLLERSNPEASGNEVARIEKIDQLVSVSANQNAKASSPTLPSIDSPRGRGRPRIGGAPNKATIAKMKNKFGVDSLPPPMNEQTSSDPKNPGASGVESGPSSDAPKVELELPPQAIKAIYGIPFLIARLNTGYEGFHLDDATGDALVDPTNEAVRLWFPNDDVDPRWVPVIAIVSILGSVLTMQAIQFEEWKRKNTIKTTGTRIEPVQEVKQ